MITLIENVRKSIVVLAATGMPGLQKLIVTLLSITIWGENFAGIYAKEVAIGYFICLLSSLGHSANVLKTIPNMERRRGEIFLSETAGSVIILSLVAYSLYTFVTILYPKLAVENRVGILLFIISNSLYQIVRSFYISKKRFGVLVYFEIIVIATFSVLIFFFQVRDYILASSVLLLFGTLIIMCREASGVVFRWENLVDLNAFQYSINTMISGGVVILLPKVVFLGWGASVVAKITLLINSISLFLLFIRSYINYQIPDLAKLLKNDQKNSFSSLSKIRGNCFLIMIGVFLSAGMSQWILSKYSFGLDILSYIVSDPYLYYAVLVFVLSSALSMADSMALFLLSKQRDNLQSNLAYFLSFTVLSVFSVNFFNISIVSYFYALAALSTVRFFYLNSRTKKYLCG